MYVVILTLILAGKHSVHSIAIVIRKNVHVTKGKILCDNSLDSVRQSILLQPHGQMLTLLFATEIHWSAQCSLFVL